MKIRPLGAELHAERRTGVPKLVVLFHNFTNAPNPPPPFFTSWCELCCVAHPSCHGNDSYRVVCSLWSSRFGPRKTFLLCSLWATGWAWRNSWTLGKRKIILPALHTTDALLLVATALVGKFAKQESSFLSSVGNSLSLTLRLLMSYMYGAPSKARNANVVHIWTYVWQRWNSLFLFAAQCFSTESMQRGFLCHICV